MAERTDMTRIVEAEVETDRSVDDIRQDIVHRRESISDTVERLGDHIQQRLDWREYLADHAMVSIGAAAGVGLLLSGLIKRRQSPKERIFDALAEGFEEITGQFFAPLGSLQRRPGIRQGVKGAAMSLVARGIANSLRNKFQRVH